MSIDLEKPLKEFSEKLENFTFDDSGHMIDADVKGMRDSIRNNPLNKSEGSFEVNFSNKLEQEDTIKGQFSLPKVSMVHRNEHLREPEYSKSNTRQVVNISKINQQVLPKRSPSIDEKHTGIPQPVILIHIFIFVGTL